MKLPSLLLKKALEVWLTAAQPPRVADATPFSDPSWFRTSRAGVPLRFSMTRRSARSQ